MNSNKYNKDLYKDYEKEILLNKELENEIKYLKLANKVAEDEKKRAQLAEKKALDKIISLKEEKEKLKKEKEELEREIKRLRYENEKFIQLDKNDSTNSSIPTSQTKIGKLKLNPNEREKSDKPIGGQKNHKKHSLEGFSDDEVTKVVEHQVEQCPQCGSTDIVKIDKKIKDTFDYLLTLEKIRNEFYVYKCEKCHIIFHEPIPNNLKEKNQYGSNVQATAIALINIGNVPINKVKRIISGLTMNEINFSEGFISKLQKRSAKKLEIFAKDLYDHVIKLKVLHWDDTVITVDGKQSCMRFYGDENLALYYAHEKKNKAGLDKDNVLSMLDATTTVVHDHNKVNYNKKYDFKNAECNQHLLRDLKKVLDNIPNRTWADKLRTLLKEYDHKRNELIKNNISSFTEGEANEFVMKFDHYVLLGIEENNKDNKPYYARKEKVLINRLIEYRDNYIYWIFDFDLPFTNNESERSLRGVKSKMKVSGQFKNITNAEYYSTIRSYIETCHRNGINEYDALKRLIEDNPYTLAEILESKKISE